MGAVLITRYSVQYTIYYCHQIPLEKPIIYQTKICKIHEKYR